MTDNARILQTAAESEAGTAAKDDTLAIMAAFLVLLGLTAGWIYFFFGILPWLLPPPGV